MQEVNQDQWKRAKYRFRQWVRIGKVKLNGLEATQRSMTINSRQMFIDTVKLFGGKLTEISSKKIGWWFITKAVFPPEAMEIITPNESAGGPQPGAGRPALPPEKKRDRYSFYITKSTWRLSAEIAQKKYGRPQRSLGVELAIERLNGKDIPPGLCDSRDGAIKSFRLLPDIGDRIYEMAEKSETKIGCIVDWAVSELAKEVL